MTPAEQIAAATAALDEARRALEALSSSPCGDDDVDGAISDARETVEAEISGLYRLLRECV